MNHNFACSIITAPQRVLVPEGVELFQHQKNAITKMVDVEATHEIINGEFTVSTNIAVYGDKVGSGKTRSMVSLIKLNRTPTKPVSETVGGNYLMRCAKNDTQTRAQTTIVIVSSDTIQNWLNEFRICNEPVFVCRKTVELEQLNILLKDVYICPNTILITNTLFRLVQPPTTFRWSRVIIDDPHRFALNEIPEANFTWLVTSDIADIIFPRRMYLKKIIPYVFSNDYLKVYESIILKNTDSYVDESIGLSQICTREMGCKTNEYIRNFKNVIARHAFSELKRGCVDVALNTLNCTVASSDDITKSCSENVRKRLRTNDCPICLDSPNPNEIAVTSCCSNAFCLTCLLHSYLMNPKCPLCKSKKCCVDLRVISNDASLYRSPKKQRIVKPLNKTQTLFHHIANNPTTKMLVYAESDILAHIQESFKKMFISFRTIIGHNQTTAAVIESFSKGWINVLIVTEKCPYVDLKMADELIFYKTHDWSVREWVVGRAQRIGRVNQLLVTDLKYDD